MSSFLTERFHDYAEESKVQVKSQNQKPGASILVKMTQNRSKANMDSRYIVEGEAGLGKSYYALRMGELLDPKFTQDPQGAVENQVVFRASEYLQGVISLPPFSVLIYDEPGQSFHHREFMSEANIILSKTMIGYRFKRFVSFLCIPTLGMIDKDAKNLVTFLVNVTAHGKAEVYKQIPDKFGGTTWFKNIIDNLHIDLPSVKLRHAYEKKKERIQDELYAAFGKTLATGEKPRITNTEIAEMIKAKGKKAEDITISSLMGDYDIGRERARAVMHKLTQNP